MAHRKTDKYHGRVITVEYLDGKKGAKRIRKLEKCFDCNSSLYIKEFDNIGYISCKKCNKILLKVKLKLWNLNVLKT